MKQPTDVATARATNVTKYNNNIGCFKYAVSECAYLQLITHHCGQDMMKSKWWEHIWAMNQECQCTKPKDSTVGVVWKAQYFHPILKTWQKCSFHLMLLFFLKHTSVTVLKQLSFYFISPKHVFSEPFMQMILRSLQALTFVMRSKITAFRCSSPVGHEHLILDTTLDIARGAGNPTHRHCGYVCKCRIIIL